VWMGDVHCLLPVAFPCATCTLHGASTENLLLYLDIGSDRPIHHPPVRTPDKQDTP
jgi:hypothetical protein